MRAATMPTTPTDLSELLALAVHEFRTPVTVAVGYLRMLASDQMGPLTDHQRKIVDDATRACTRLSGLVEELSDLASLDSGGVALAHGAVDVPALLAELARDATEGRDRGVTLQVEAPPTPLIARGDRRRLRDALDVLLRAVLREQSTPCVVRAVCLADRLDGRGVARVGIGPEEAAAAVLESPPDARLNESRGGLGLGLPIARRVVAALGGRVWSIGTERHIGAIGFELPLKEHS